MLNNINSYMTGNLKEDEYNKIRSGFQGSWKIATTQAPTQLWTLHSAFLKRGPQLEFQFCPFLIM